MIRESLHALARNESIGGLINRTPITRGVVKRVVGGESAEQAVEVAAALADEGLWVSVERAATQVESSGQADEVLADYVDLVHRLADAGLVASAEVAVLPDALRLNDEASGVDRLAHLAKEATDAGVPVTVGAGSPESVDATLAAVAALHDEGHLVGVTIPAALRRSELDCEAWRDRRVRLVKGGHRADPAIAFRNPQEVDKAFVRCAKSLLRGTGEPSFATHDPRLIEILEALVVRAGRPKQTYEFAMYLGRQESAQERLLAAGERVRVYVPYGPEWFERLVGGLAEQPTSIAAALRSLLPGG